MSVNVSPCMYIPSLLLLISFFRASDTGGYCWNAILLSLNALAAILILGSMTEQLRDGESRYVVGQFTDG